MIRAVPNFFKTVYEEATKVVWPTREQTLRKSLMVVISGAIATVIYASLDLGLTNLVRYIINR